MDGGQQASSWLVAQVPQKGDPFDPRYSGASFVGVFDGLNAADAVENAAAQPGRYVAVEVVEIEVALKAT